MRGSRRASCCARRLRWLRPRAALLLTKVGQLFLKLNLETAIVQRTARRHTMTTLESDTNDSTRIIRRHTRTFCPRTVSNIDALNGILHEYYSSNYWSSSENKNIDGVWMCSNCKHFCFGFKNCKPSPWDN